MLSEPPLIVVLRFLWTGRGRLLKWAAGGLILTLIAAFLIPKRYTASVKLMPPDASQMNLGLMIGLTGIAASPANAGLASNLLTGRTQGGEFIGVIQSQTVEDDLINRFDLRKVYRLRTYYEARKKLSDRTYANEDRKSGIITISVVDNDKYRARDLANAYVEELNKLMTAMDTSSAHRERVFLETRLKAVKQDLDLASLQLSQFSSRNGELNVPDQGRATLEATARLQGELIAAESELNSLKAAYSDGNVRVQQARARVLALQRSLQKMGGIGAEGAGEASGEPLPSLRQIPLLGYTYFNIYRQVQIEQTLYETLTKQYELAKLEEAKELPIVKVLDPALLPEKKSFPPRILIMVLGVFLAMVAAAVRELTAQWWRNLDDADPRKSVLREIAGECRQSGWQRRLGLRRDPERDLAAR